MSEMDGWARQLCGSDTPEAPRSIEKEACDYKPTTIHRKLARTSSEDTARSSQQARVQGPALECRFGRPSRLASILNLAPSLSSYPVIPFFTAHSAVSICRSANFCRQQQALAVNVGAPYISHHVTLEYHLCISSLFG